jgi:pimeloyl-ACP methyl ester carboxylesterase
MTPTRSWHWWIRRIWVSAGTLFMAWIIWNMQAHGVPDQMRESSPAVIVSTRSDMTIFMPAGAESTTPALVFLPGGGVDPDAYVPLVRRLAERGVPLALVRLPWRMAFSESAQAETWARVLRAHTLLGATRPLVLAGHSRGAALTGTFASSYGSMLSGLIMIGTTHPRDHDLSGLPIPVLKVAGTRDCVADLDGSRANARNLPPSTQWVVIEGANHAQFGYYGSQLGDCAATISRDDQQTQTFEAIVGWGALGNVSTARVPPMGEPVREMDPP